MAGDGQSLGKAKVEITADTTQFNASVDAAKAKLNEVGTSAKQAGDEVWEGMTRAAEATKEVESEAQQTTSAFSNLSLNIAAVGATLLVVLDTVSKIKDFIETTRFDGLAEAGKFLDKIQNQKAESRLSQIREEMKKIYEELEETQRHWLNAGPPGVQLYGRSIQSLKEQLKTLQQAYDAASVSVLETDNKRAETSNSKMLNNLGKLQQETLDDLAKHEQEQSDSRAKMLLNLEKLRAESQADYIRMLKQQEQIEQRIGQQRIRDILAATNALERMMETQRNGFGASDAGGSLAAQINNLTEEMRRISLRSNGAVN